MNPDELELPESSPSLLPALRHRNFQLYYVGQAISLLGSWMQTVALAWLVWKLAEKPSYLGMVTFASQIPNLLFTPLAGVLADRYSRHRLIIATQTLAMLQATILASLTLTGLIRFPHVLLLAFFLGTINSFDMPFRQSFVVELVGKADLPNAIALNSFSFNGARILGPALAGLLIRFFSDGETGASGIEGKIFVINAVSFLMVIGALLMLRVAPRPMEIHPGNMAEHLKEAVAFVLRQPALRDFLLYIGLISFMGFPYQMLMPAFAAKILHGGADVYSNLMSALGFGALLGAVVMIRGSLNQRLDLMVPISGVGFGLGLTLLSFSRSAHLSMFLLVPTGGSMMILSLCTNTLLQKLVPDRLRGRIMSFYTMMLLGFVPLGSLLAGKLAEWIGLLPSMRFGAAICIAGGIVLFLRLPLIRKSIGTLQSESLRGP